MNKRRKRVVRVFLLLLVLIALVAFGPVIVQLAATGYARSHDCVLHEAFSNPCFVDGADRGELLYSLYLFGWLSQITIQIGIVATAFWALLFLIYFVSARGKD